MKSFNKRLKDLREDFDLNQSQIADLLKTTQQQYSKYENGQQEMPIRHLVSLAKFYNITTDYLLGLSDEKQEFPKKREFSN